MIETIKGPELAEMLGISPRYLGDLEKAGVIKKEARGEWALRESVRGFCMHLRKQASTVDDEATGYDADKARKMKADADLAEIVAAKAAGKLVVAKFVGVAWQTAIGVAMTKLGSVGQKIAATVLLERTAAGASAKISDAIRAACEEVYQMDIAEIARAQEESEALKQSQEQPMQTNAN
jgi:hypothetical protein